MRSRWLVPGWRWLASWWPGRQRKPVKARGLTRVVTLDRWWVTVRVRWWTWWWWPQSRKIGRRRQVRFHVKKIDALDWTSPWLFTGVVRINVPGANDPWGRATSREDGSALIPPAKPHKIRFWWGQVGRFQTVVFGANGNGVTQ